MSRKKRIWYPGATYYVMSRGNRRTSFRNNSKEEYRMFVEGKISHAEQEMLIQKDIKEDDMWLPW